MPCYNSAATIERSSNSVCAQTHGNFELIIVDDGSHDDSAVIIERIMANDPRVRYLRQQNKGAAAARNFALAHAQGEYTAFLDADDTWEPTFLDKMTQALRQNSAAGVAYCGWQNLYYDKEDGEKFIPPNYETPDKVKVLLGGCRWPIHGALGKTQQIREVGGFNEALTSCMDYDLWLRLGTRQRLVLVPKVLAYYWHHTGEQITKDKAKVGLNHWKVQKAFIETHPDAVRDISRTEIRALTHGELLRRAYACYWQGDMNAARKMFKRVMSVGYGKPRDWLYMMPSLLPLPLHDMMLTFARRFRSQG